MRNKSLTFKNNINTIVESDLCCGCGFCSSVCPQQCIQHKIVDDKGQYRPFIQEENCNSCQTCLSICPGADDDWLLFTPDAWKKTNRFHPRLGHYARLCLASSTRQDIQRGGSSGGIATELLIYLLEQGLVDGAITTAMSKANPLIAIPVLAKEPDQIRLTQQSKYCPVPLGTILETIKSEPGRYAIVALPCCVNAIRQIQEMDPNIKKSIPYIIGLFCSRTPSFHATHHILQKRNILPQNIQQIEYRSGSGHVGYMKISMKNGQTIKIPHLHFDYWGYMFAKFFMPVRCYLCTDKVAGSADISLGDNWSQKMKRSGGTSTMVIRSPQMTSIIEAMHRTHFLEMETVDEETVVVSQDLVRKQNIEPRRFWWGLFGGKLPRFSPHELQKTSFIEKIGALPDFIRLCISRRKRNKFLLVSLARISWLLDSIFHFLAKLTLFVNEGLSHIWVILKGLAPAPKSFVSKKASKKIVLMGGYGSKDIGDESMPHCDIMHFRECLGNTLEIVMLSEDPSNTSEYHQERAISDIQNIGFSPSSGIISKIYNFFMSIHITVFLVGVYLFTKNFHLRLWPSAFNALREIASADLLFNVGGGNLNSIIPQEFYKKGTIYIAASILGKPIVVSGQTIGPFYGILDRYFGRYVLNKPEIITFRDSGISQQRCREIGITRPLLMDAADDAMALPYLKEKEAVDLLKADPGVSSEWLERKAEVTIAMNLKGSLRIFKLKGQKADLSKMTNKFSQLADLLLENFDSKIIFIPTDFNAEVDDRELHYEVTKTMRHINRAASLENEYADTALKGIINLADVAIGARYHFCVFACSLYKPFLGIASGIYQMTKLKGLALLNELPQCFYENDLESADLEDLYSRANAIIMQRQSFSKQLQISVPKLKEMSKTAVNYAIELMGKDDIL